jgi:hypothetical protein
MKAFAIAALGLLAAAPASADHIGLYADPNGLSCVAPLLPAPTLNVVYAINENGTGTTGSKWRISHDVSLVSVSFTLTNPYLPIVPIGDPLTFGTTVWYLVCRASPYVIGQVGFLYFGGPVAGCDHLRVEAHQGDPWYAAEATVVVADCADVKQVATGGRFSFDATGACDSCGGPLPVQSTTWGAVKSLYR